MIVVMSKGAEPSDIQAVVELVREQGFKEQVIQGTELTVVAVIGDDRKKDQGVYASMRGVSKVLPILAPYKRASIEIKSEPSVVSISDQCVLGGKAVPIIAGPCSVESEEQIIKTAEQVKAAGAVALRGGAFKPRTNPYSFQGLGETGLKYLATAREVTGLAIVTEVVSESDVELVSSYADCLQIGTRNAQNFRLLEAVGKQPKPVMFKRGYANTLDEYLQAAEYILDAGNPNVILCERGIRTFERFSRNTLSLSAVAELKYRTHLPVVVDPSHGTGHARLVAKMTNAAIACGADGIIIEVHHDPAHALTDGAQSISPEAMQEAMPQWKAVAEAVDRSISTSMD